MASDGLCGRNGGPGSLLDKNIAGGDEVACCVILRGDVSCRSPTGG
jgi:hypothetical protein